MKVLLTYLLFVLSLVSVEGQTSHSKQLEQLIQDSFDEIFSSYQEEKLSQFYTDDFLLLEQGEVWSMDTIREYLRKTKSNPNPSQRTNRFEFIKTVVEGNRAWIAYHNWATISQNGQLLREIYWLESATAILTEKGWRLEMLHSTRAENDK